MERPRKLGRGQEALEDGSQDKLGGGSATTNSSRHVVKLQKSSKLCWNIHTHYLLFAIILPNNIKHKMVGIQSGITNSEPNIQPVNSFHTRWETVSGNEEWRAEETPKKIGKGNLREEAP